MKEQHQHGDSSSLGDRPPEEFCSSPDPSTKFLPIDLLQKEGEMRKYFYPVGCHVFQAEKAHICRAR